MTLLFRLGFSTFQLSLNCFANEGGHFLFRSEDGIESGADAFPQAHIRRPDVQRRPDIKSPQPKSLRVSHRLAITASPDDEKRAH